MLFFYISRAIASDTFIFFWLAVAAIATSVGIVFNWIYHSRISSDLKHINAALEQVEGPSAFSKNFESIDILLNSMEKISALWSSFKTFLIFPKLNAANPIIRISIPSDACFSYDTLAKSYLGRLHARYPKDLIIFCLVGAAISALCNCYLSTKDLNISVTGTNVSVHGTFHPELLFVALKNIFMVSVAGVLLALSYIVLGFAGAQSSRHFLRELNKKLNKSLQYFPERQALIQHSYEMQVQSKILSLIERRLEGLAEKLDVLEIKSDIRGSIKIEEIEGAKKLENLDEKAAAALLKSTPISRLYGNRDLADPFFRSELEALAESDLDKHSFDVPSVPGKGAVK